jgi:predicted TIM-barrel fold metal-dependent hydrolase
MKIDIFCHITPPEFLKIFEKKVSPQICEHLPNRWLPSLSDLDTRFRVMDNHKDVVQVLTLTNPPIELVAEPPVSVELAKVANDEMADLVVRYPDRFVGAVAALPLNDLDATLEEVDRAIRDLNFKGVQIFSHVAGKPLDTPELMPLYEKMAEYDLPIWIHPFFESLPGSVAKDSSQFKDFRVFVGKDDPAAAMDRGGFQIAYRSTPALTRLVYSGVFDKYPNIKFIAHHCGSAVPYFAGRIEMHYDMYKVREGADHGLGKPILDYYRMFYADTALHGTVPALMCGYDFFGTQHLLFGTDMPFDAELGLWSVRKTIESIEQAPISDAEREKIFEVNARELLRLPV